MPIRDLLFRIRARDETSETLEQVESGWTEAFGRVALAGVAAAGSIAEALSQGLERAQNSLQTYQLATGGGSAEQRALFDAIQGDTFLSPEIVAEATQLTSSQFDIQSTQGRELVGSSLAQFIFQGGNAQDAVAAAQGFGIDQPAGIANLLDVGYTSAIQAGAQPGEIFQPLTTYGAGLRAAGFDAYQSLQFAAAASSLGIPAERPLVGVSQFARNASEAGVEDIGGLLGSAFSNITESETDSQALAFAQQVFGEEGSVAITDILRSGALGNLEYGRLGGVQLTDEQVFESALDQLAQSGATGQAAAGALGLAQNVPGAGFFGSIGGALAGGGRGRFEDSPELFSARPAALSGSLSQAGVLAELETSEAAERSTSNLEIQINELLRGIREREQYNNNLPAGITYDPQRAAAANEADLRRIGLLTGELSELRGG